MNRWTVRVTPVCMCSRLTSERGAGFLVYERHYTLKVRARCSVQFAVSIVDACAKAHSPLW